MDGDNLTADKHQPAHDMASEQQTGNHEQPQAPREIGGPGGPEPTRYGDWERRGRCIDF